MKEFKEHIPSESGEQFVEQLAWAKDFEALSERLTSFLSNDSLVKKSGNESEMGCLFSESVPSIGDEAEQRKFLLLDQVQLKFEPYVVHESVDALVRSWGMRVLSSNLLDSTYILQIDADAELYKALVFLNIQSEVRYAEPCELKP